MLEGFLPTLSDWDSHGTIIWDDVWISCRSSHTHAIVTDEVFDGMSLKLNSNQGLAPFRNGAMRQESATTVVIREDIHHLSISSKLC